MLPSHLELCTWVFPALRVAWHQTAPLGAFKLAPRNGREEAPRFVCHLVVDVLTFVYQVVFLRTSESLFRFGACVNFSGAPDQVEFLCINFHIITFAPFSSTLGLFFTGCFYTLISCSMVSKQTMHPPRFQYLTLPVMFPHAITYKKRLLNRGSH